jgi:hypothetical protein
VGRQGARKPTRSRTGLLRYRAIACPTPGARICCLSGSNQNVEVGHTNGREVDRVSNVFSPYPWHLVPRLRYRQFCSEFRTKTNCLRHGSRRYYIYNDIGAVTFRIRNRVLCPCRGLQRKYPGSLLNKRPLNVEQPGYQENCVVRMFADFMNRNCYIK